MFDRLNPYFRLRGKRTVVLCGILLSISLLNSGWASELFRVAQVEEGDASAVAVMHPTEGNVVSGTVRFTQTATGMAIEAHLSGLTEGNHGFHIHQYGDCSAANGTSAGGHFNPGHAAHAGPDVESRHVGDMGNITADAEGSASYSGMNSHLTFEGQNNIIGRAVIVHGGEDDLASQPTGAAGPRMGCGVIGYSAPSAE
jgi:Cu-Zn family superoxide dismutase